MTTEVSATNVSLNIGDMTLEQLVRLSQGLGHEIEKLRSQRQYLNKHITDRLARGERTSLELREDVPGEAGINAQAAGATIDVKQG